MKLLNLFENDQYGSMVEGSTSRAELHAAYIQAVRAGNSTMAAHYAKELAALDNKTKGVEESDPSGVLHAARHLNKEWRITADVDGAVKQARVKAQSSRSAQEKFMKRYPTAQLHNVEDITQMSEQGVAEGGSFNYGAKTPRKGSQADLTAKKRKEQDKNYKPIEPTDQQVGVARVTKGMAEGEQDLGPDYQDRVKRLGQMAQQGPRKTVWDPVKQVYKTVPVNAPEDQTNGNAIAESYLRLRNQI